MLGISVEFKNAKSKKQFTFNLGLYFYFNKNNKNFPGIMKMEK